MKYRSYHAIRLTMYTSILDKIEFYHEIAILYSILFPFPRRLTLQFVCGCMCLSTVDFVLLVNSPLHAHNEWISVASHLTHPPTAPLRSVSVVVSLLVVVVVAGGRSGWLFCFLHSVNMRVLLLVASVVVLVMAGSSMVTAREHPSPLLSSAQLFDDAASPASALPAAVSVSAAPSDPFIAEALLVGLNCSAIASPCSASPGGNCNSHPLSLCGQSPISAQQYCCFKMPKPGTKPNAQEAKALKTGNEEKKEVEAVTPAVASSSSSPSSTELSAQLLAEASLLGYSCVSTSSCDSCASPAVCGEDPTTGDDYCCSPDANKKKQMREKMLTSASTTLSTSTPSTAAPASSISSLFDNLVDAERSFVSSRCHAAESCSQCHGKQQCIDTVTEGKTVLCCTNSE